MSNFERVLTDDELWAAAAEVEWQGTIGQYRLIEQAVLAKLAEQEPVAWFIDDKRVCGNRIITDLAIAKDWLEANPDKVTPLYALPCVASVCDKTACVSESGESDRQPVAWLNEETGDIISDELAKQAVKLHQSYGVPLYRSVVFNQSNCQGFLDNSNQEGSSWLPPLPEADVYGYRDSYSEELLIEYAKSAIDHYRTTKSRTPASGENVNLLISVDTDGAQALLRSYLDSLEGWQLVPSEPTMDMIKALLETIVTTSKGGVVNPKTTLTYALAAAPKYTGESK